MRFTNTKKYLFDIASLRLDCKINNINHWRQELASKEYFWQTGKNKKLKPKYKRLTNKEICPSNPPLVGQIRNGKINSKNPYLYTPTVLHDIYNNCKLIPNSSSEGLIDDELVAFRKRNFMFLSYDELFFGNSGEQRQLRFFFRTAIILDILYEKIDENLWRLVLGYLPLNIMFERIKLEVKDVKEVYMILKNEHWELLLTGIVRVANKHLFKSFEGWSSVEELFVTFCNDSIQMQYEEQNKLIGLEKVLEKFYEIMLKNVIKDDFAKVNPILIKDDALTGIYNYQSLESLIAIQNEMRQMQEWLGSDDARYLYATKVVKSVDEFLNSLTLLQESQENDEHWNGNSLGYVKKYYFGDKIQSYFESGNRKILEPLIIKNIEASRDIDELKEMYMKKHPESWLMRKRI